MSIAVESSRDLKIAKVVGRDHGGSEGRCAPWSRLERPQRAHTGVTLADRRPDQVAIVIPVRDALAMTRACLESLRTCTPSGDYEVIVVDNGSGLDTQGYLQSMARSGAITLLRNSNNLGFAKACNQGIRAARGRAVLLLNNDTLVTKGWLAAMRRELEHDPRVGVVGSCLLYPGGSRLQHAGVAIGWYRDCLFPYHVHRLRDVKYVPEARRSRDVKAVTGACLLVRPEVLAIVAGLDEEYINGYEDIDFCFQVLKAGFRVRYCGESLVYHHESVSEGRHEHDAGNLGRLNRKWKGVLPPDEKEPATRAAIQEIWAREALQRHPTDRRCLALLQGICLQRDDYDEAREYRAQGHSAVPKVSIVIPTYRNLELTKQCLRSIRATTGDIPLEIICVDNASQDGTVAYLRSEGSGHELTVISNDRNLGFAKACNQGARLTLGQYVVFLNNDTVALDGWLQEMLQCVEDDPEVGVVGSRLLYPQGSVQHAGVAFGEDLVPFHIYRFAPHDASYVLQNRESTAVTGACCLVRRDLFLDLGGFNEAYENGLEDVDFCLRVKDRLRRIVYCGKSTLIHLESVSPGRFAKTTDNYRRFFDAWGEKLVADAASICAQDGTDPGKVRALEMRLRRGEGISKGQRIDYLREPALPVRSEEHPWQTGRIPDSVPMAGLCSIIILSLNQWGWTRACLESIQKHTPQPYEILLVDNGSTRETVDALLAFTQKDPRITVILNAQNRGFARGNNLGLALARGESIVLLNNDTLVAPGWLEGLTRVLAAEPRVGIVGPMSNHVAGPQQVDSAHYSSIEEFERFARDWREQNRQQTFSASAVIGFCLLLRRRVLQAIGGLDELFGVGNFEDIDYCYRAQLYGEEIRVSREVFIHHQGSLTFRSEKVNYERLMRKNWELFKAKWGLPPLMAMGQKAMVPDRKQVLRQRVELPDLRRTHQFQPEERIWRDQALRSSSFPVPSPQAIGSDSAPVPMAKGLLPGSCGEPEPRVDVYRPGCSPLASIIIPTYQNLELTKQCLRGLWHHTEKGSYEIIVVDNHSTDGTAEYLREMHHQGLLKALLQPINEGFARACNRGAGEASAPFLIFLNNDTFPLQGWLPPLLLPAQRDHTVAMVGCKLLYPDGRVQHAGMELLHRDGERSLPFPIPGHPHRFASANAPEVNRYRELDMVTGACLLVRQDVFTRLGGFDEVYRNGVEDVDLCLRVRYAGYKVVYQPQAVLIHHEGQSPGRFDKDSVCNNLTIYYARWRTRFGDDGRIQIPQPPRLIRAHRSVLTPGVPTGSTKGAELHRYQFLV